MLAVLAALTGCSALEGTGDKGYISGDGTIVQYDVADRGEPVALAGASLEGRPLDVAEARGRPVVVNVWWSGCAPCRTEMPLLVDAARDLGSQVEFVGVNSRDNSAANATTFAEALGVTFPSIYDPTGEALLAFAGKAPLQSVPITLVLDPEGRVAASINGVVPSRTTLVDLVEEVAAEGGSAEGAQDG